MQRLVDKGQHAFQIAVDFIVPETQYPEAFAVPPTLPPPTTTLPLRGGIFAAVQLNDNLLVETDEIYDIVITRGLAAEMESLFSPRTQMNPQFYLLRGHLFAQAASDFVRHSSPTRPPSAATLPLRGRDCSVGQA